MTKVIFCIVFCLLAVSCKAPPIPEYQTEYQGATEKVKTKPLIHAKPVQSPSVEMVPRKGKIELVEPSVELGDIERGETIRHTFVVKNKSDKPLKIFNIRGG